MIPVFVFIDKGVFTFSDIIDASSSLLFDLIIEGSGFTFQIARWI